MVPTNDAATLVGGKANLVVGLTPEPTAARYVELEEINRGGCGVVMRAYDKHLRCEVALKRILPELAHDSNIKSRFFHEARVTARLAHPGIAPIHDAGDDPQNGLPFYTMKWLQGPTLSEVLEQHHALLCGRSKSRSFRELLVRFRHVCQTLSYAHQRGVVHRDLKPSNILMGEFGETIVLDWGLAKELYHQEPHEESLQLDEASVHLPYHPAKNIPLSNHDLTAAGSILGTASYMSPEQAAGKSHLVDTRSDVFSLGVILYEILAGVSPFRCPTQQETLQHILRSEYRPLQQLRPRVPKPLAAICDRALELEPNARYANAGELERDIQAWLAGDCVSAYREPWWGTLDRLASKYRAIFWSALVSLLLISVISVASTITVTRAHRNEKLAREAAETAQVQKSLSLAREMIAHQEAITQLQQARASIDGWLLGLDSVLALYPGLSPLRNHLFQQAIDYYSVLAEQTAESSMMRLEVVRAKIRLGDLQHLNGHADDALCNYHCAIEHLRSEPSPVGDWQTVADLQQAAALLGICHIDLEHNRLDSVLAGLGRAIALCASTPETSPQFIEACDLLARGHRLKSLALRQQGDLDQAALNIKQAITLYEARILPTNQLRSTTQQRQTFITMLDDLATVLLDSQDFAGANDALQQMIHFYDRLLDTDPKRPDWIEARALARMRSGWCNMQLVAPNEAVAQLEASEDDLQNAWQLFKGEHTYLDKLAQIHNALGHSYFVGGDMDQAHQLLTRSLKHLGRQPDHRQEPEALSRWIQTRLYLATIELRRGVANPATLQGVETAVTSLLPHKRLKAVSRQSHAQYHWLATQTQMLMGQHDEAAASLDRAIQWQTQQPVEDQDACWHFWLARLHAQQAKVAGIRKDELAQANHWDLAQEHWQAAYAANHIRWSAHAGFELFESWAHSSQLSDDRVQAALQMARDILSDHETLPTAWFWLAELAYHAGDLELAANAHEKLERLRRRETLDDRLLKALIHPDQPVPSELLTTPCVPGSHAAWLQKACSREGVRSKE